MPPSCNVVNIQLGQVLATLGTLILIPFQGLGTGFFPCQIFWCDIDDSGVQKRGIGVFDGKGFFRFQVWVCGLSAEIFSEMDVLQLSDEDGFSVSPFYAEVPAVVPLGDFAFLVLLQKPVDAFFLMLVLQPNQHALIDPEIQLSGIMAKANIPVVVTPTPNNPVE